MQKNIELQQLIFNLFETQIKFGVHRCGESLPTIKEASSYFMSSVDTVRLAYVQLKHEGYISLSTGVGAKVKVNYSDEDIRRHIHNYFSCRRESLLSFALSAKPLANYTLWFALKNASPEILDELEHSCLQKDIPPVYRMSQQLQLIYGPLGNDLLLRLYWQMFLFFQAPLVSVPQNIKVVNSNTSPLLSMIQAVRAKDWTELWDIVDWTATQYYDGLCRFFGKISVPKTGGEPGHFSWNIYKKASQICYTLCMELQIAICEGYYPAGSFLPSPKELAVEKEIGIKTIRRTIALLNKLGATETVNGVGTRILSPSFSNKNCDFTDTTLRKRLVDFVQSLHIVALSCRACAQITVDSMDAYSINQCLEQLEEIKRIENHEKLIYVCYKTISTYAPYPAIRAVYSEMKQQLFWGFPLQPHGGKESTNAYFLPYIETLMESLRQADAESFSRKFENLQIAETNFLIKELLHLGIEEAGALRIPCAEELERIRSKESPYGI